MESLARRLVRLAKGGARSERAGFLQSVTGHFCAAHEDEATVNCGLAQSQFVISDSAFPGSTRLVLKRPSFCPIKHLEERQAAALPEALRGRGVDVGVAVILQAIDGRVLLTRRAKNLSIFPNIWVPPGGHLEPEEELLEAGLRELQEETGLQLVPGEFSWRMLGLWESVYPPMLSRGLPWRHHIVMYLLLLSTENHQQLQTRIKADECEVSAYAWLEPHVLEAIAAVEDGAENTRPIPSNLPATVKAMELRGHSAHPVELPIATFLNTAPAAGEDVERVSTGTRFALCLWLNTFAQPGLYLSFPRCKMGQTRPSPPAPSAEIQLEQRVLLHQ
ncbi:m7GpppN-mRNA hydrolase NUDT17 isoform X2 [Carettochelys insculpta]|uniref:m7GpppN-mRNA hydrolase NUDT17 isoform X2 n=1 Tax=Carettochelys insculpta TaxID=44489 RepID=UPI003EB7113B